MKKSISVYCLLILLIGFSNSLFSQRSPGKLGSVDKAELEMDYIGQYPDANAVVLFDFGNLYFTYDQNKGFQYVFERHTRIKVLNRDGLDWGNVKVSLYKQRGDREILSKLNAYTYNLVDGKVVREKMGNSAVFNDEVSENLADVRFALPNVMEGSVIEYSYSVTSGYYFNLPTWYFQRSIPVLHSEFITKIPEYFRYKVLMKGYEPLALNEERKESQVFTILVSSSIVSSGGLSAPTRVPAQTHRIDAIAAINRRMAKNMPAFIEEPYLTSASDYMTGLEFELSSTNFPGQYVRPITSTWEDIRKNMMESETFGRQLRRANFLSSVSDFIIANNKGDQDKMVQAYYAIQDRMRWNELNRISVTKTLRDAYNEQVGSSADINMMLVVLLRDLGLNANPVILSTRRNGMVHPARIMISQFNYLIAHVKIDGKDYLLDATDKHCPHFLLPERSLNGQGRIISEDFSDWIDLNPGRNYYEVTMVNLAADDQNVLKGSIQRLRRNYSAYSLKRQLADDEDYKDYRKSMEDKFPGIKIEDYTVENMDNLSAGVKENFTVQITAVLSSTGDLIFFNPMLHERIEKNPFTLEERRYPVDYTYTFDDTYIFNLEIPKGYAIDELPTSLRVPLPDDAGMFTYQTSVIGNKVQVIAKLQRNKIVFVYSDYKNLKEFYDQMVNKHSEQIVLKKI